MESEGGGGGRRKPFPTCLAPSSRNFHTSCRTARIHLSLALSSCVCLSVCLSTYALLFTALPNPPSLGVPLARRPWLGVPLALPHFLRSYGSHVQATGVHLGVNHELLKPLHGHLPLSVHLCRVALVRIFSELKSTTRSRTTERTIV